MYVRLQIQDNEVCMAGVCRIGSDNIYDICRADDVAAVLQRCGTVVHVAKSGFDSHILSFLCLKMAGVITCDHRMFVKRISCDLYDNRSDLAD